MVERNTHLLAWLEDGYTSCQHGSKEWAEGYLHNARNVIVDQDARIAQLERENASLLEIVTRKVNEKIEAERELAEAREAGQRQYDENVNRIAAEGAAILRAEAAEAERDRLAADNARLRDALKKRASWHKCSCPEPCDDYNVFPGGCAGRYAADYAELLQTGEQEG